MALFGGTTRTRQPRILCEFKAGKMKYNRSEHMVYPDKRKGLLYFLKTPDGTIHVCWKERSDSITAPENVTYIEPDSAEFTRVTQTTTGRVFLLKSNTSEIRQFFWMQEPRDDKDEEICKKVNDILNPRTRGTNAYRPSGDTSTVGGIHPLLQQRLGGTGIGINPDDLTTVFQGMSQAEFLSMLGISNGAMIRQTPTQSGTSTQRTTTPIRVDRSHRRTQDSRPNTAPATTHATLPSTGNTQRRMNNASSKDSKSKSNAIEMSSLNNVLSNMNTNAQSKSDSSDSISKPENFVQILSNKNVQEKLRSKLPTEWSLPTNENQCRAMIESTEYKQALQAFSSLLQSRQLGSVLDEFQFSNELITFANNGDMKSFADGLERHYDTQDRDSSNKSMETN